MAIRSLAPIRCALLLALVVLWAWAGSVFTPWAADLDPRMWLYDTRYYLGFVLLAWGVVETALLLVRARNRAPGSVHAPLALLALAGATVVAVTALEDSAAGLALRTRWSAEALRAEIDAGDSDVRHRSGWWLVDTRRHPCGTAPWLWLGRPFGGGTGTSLALVHDPQGTPASPDPDAFRFRPIVDGWWLAYQHGTAYRQGLEVRRGKSCEPGRPIANHAQGLRFVDAGRASP